jgi:hypothetical protein
MSHYGHRTQQGDMLPASGSSDHRGRCAAGLRTDPRPSGRSTSPAGHRLTRAEPGYRMLLSTPACSAPPMATTVSGLMLALSFFPPVSSLTRSATAGICVDPPASTT